jgi:hypothetical protein
MEKERLTDRIFRKMHAICNCFSVASRQAKEAEIDLPAKRSFRRIYASGEASSDLPQDAGRDLQEVVARTGIGVRTFLDCLTDANHRAEQAESDVLSRRSYRELQGLDLLSAGKDDAAPDSGERFEDVPGTMYGGGTASSFPSAG